MGGGGRGGGGGGGVLGKLFIIIKGAKIFMIVKSVCKGNLQSEIFLRHEPARLDNKHIPDNS